MPADASSETGSFLGFSEYVGQLPKQRWVTMLKRTIPRPIINAAGSGTAAAETVLPQLNRTPLSWLTPTAVPGSGR